MSTPTTLTDAALGSVASERERQNAKFGDQRSLLPGTWHLILAEEVGEIAKAILDREPTANLRAECVQVAAVAVAMVEAIDSGRLVSQ